MSNHAAPPDVQTVRRALLQGCAAAAVGAWPLFASNAAAPTARKTRKAPSPGTGAKKAPPLPLPAGKFHWMPAIAPAGPLVVVVNLALQIMHVYRNGLAIGYSSISSGRRGNSTPTGLFSVLEKRRHHRSNLYNNAPMPYMVRLTWGGVAIHGGALPGYPASRGCIRLPMPFAAHLFAAIKHADCVAIVSSALPSGISPFNMLAPLAHNGQPTIRQASLLDAGAHWLPQNAADAPADAPQRKNAEGPFQLLVSLKERRLYALRNGQIQGAATLAPNSDFERAHLQTALYTWHASANPADTVQPEQPPSGAWINSEQAPIAIDQLLQQSLQRDAASFMHALRLQLQPGSTLLVTHLPAINDIHAAVWELA